MADKNNESILTSEDEESEEEEMSEDEVDSDEEEDDDDEYLDDEEEDEEGADKISFDDDVASVEGGASIDGGASIAESVSFDGGVFASDKMDDVGSVGTLDTEISMSSQITNTPFKIRNRDKRREKAIQLKQEQRKMKMKERKQRQKARREMGDSAVNVSKPITLDNQREKEDTMVEINDQEVLLEEQDDEFASYFNSTKQTPKILLTTSDRPRSFTTRFLKELQQSLPNSDVYYRRAIPLKKIIPQCVKRGYTDIIMINEDRKKPTGMLVCHLPNGPTAHFKLTNAKVRKQIKNSTNPSEHKPEIILNNFGTRLGHRVGRMFSSLYPHEPEFRGRQVCTFHNQRDFIFFRHHRYIIREGKRCGLQEIGPRFTLKLRSLQKGSFDTKYGEYEWIHKPKEMDKSRRKFHL